MRRTLLGSLAVITAVLFVAAEASAQPGGGFPGGGFPGGGFSGGGRGDRGDRGGGERGGGERGGGERGGGRGGFDPTEMLRRMDQNGNGTIEPNEVSGRGGGFVRGMAERAGLDPNQPLPIDKLAAAGSQFGQDRGRSEDRNRDDRNRDDRDRNRDENRSSSSGSGATPAPPSGVQGFGTPAGAAAPPAALGFDVPLTAVAGAPIEQRFDDRVVEYVKENMLRERDVNKNNMLERSEWTGRWSTPPEESDLNKDGILSFEELCVRIAKRFNLEAQARGGSSGGSSSFGSSPGSGPPSGPFGGPPGGDPARFRTFAESLIRQNDKNGNGMLEREEWATMRSEHQAADANKDGVITVEELAASLQAYSAGGGGGWGSRGDRGGDRGNSFGGGGDRGGWGSRASGGDSKTALAKKSYRVSSPVERLPKGLPDFFLRNDTDSDGQISMAEYAATWNDQIAAEFAKLDANGDGILTPDECVKKY